MVNFVKGFGEVYNKYICLFFRSKVVDYVINKYNKFGFIGFFVVVFFIL